jgi:hypothetical protein
VWISGGHKRYCHHHRCAFGGRRGRVLADHHLLYSKMGGMAGSAGSGVFFFFFFFFFSFQMHTHGFYYTSPKWFLFFIPLLSSYFFLHRIARDIRAF